MSNEHRVVYSHETTTLNLFVVDVPRFQRTGMKKESGTCLLLTEVPSKFPANISVSHWLGNAALIWEFNEMACLIPKFSHKYFFSAMSSVLWMQFSLVHLCTWTKTSPKVDLKRTDRTKQSLWELQYLDNFFFLFLHKSDLKHCQTQTCYAFVCRMSSLLTRTSCLSRLRFRTTCVLVVTTLPALFWPKEAFLKG